MMKKNTIPIVLLSIIVTVCTPLHLHALDEIFYTSNNILMYNKDFQNGCSTTTGSQITNLTGNSNLKKIFNFLYQKLLTIANSPEQAKILAAGAYGNIHHESGGTGDPTLVQYSFAKKYGSNLDDPSPIVRGGYGIIQWDPGKKIIGLLKQAGIDKPPGTLEAQLELVWWHMNNTAPPGKRNILEGYKKINDIEKAVIYYELNMEAAGKKAYPSRIRAAKEAMNFNVDTSQESTEAIKSVSNISYSPNSVGNIPAEGIQVGATMYGGSADADIRDNKIGYKEDILNNTVSYAELGNGGKSIGDALGKLPYKTKLAITYNNRTVVAEKLDTGRGGGPIKGSPRKIDLWWQVAKMLGMKDNEVVTIRPVDPNTPLTPLSDDVIAQGSPEAVSTGCASGGNTQAFINTDGYAFPLGLKKSEIGKPKEGYSPLPCLGTGPTSCHHSPWAFDIGKVNGFKEGVGVPVFAISDGEIAKLSNAYDGIVGCQSIQFKSSKDGYIYWYGHIQRASVRKGDKVTAGQQIAVIGESKCARNTVPHLHIDRGSPKGSFGGTSTRRDPGINDVINSLYRSLP